MGNHELSFLIISFLLGSVPTGYLICKLKEKKDIRETGSGNIGATNVFRVCGKNAAILTLAFDIIKGALPVFYAIIHFNSVFMIILGGAAAITGHLFSPFVKFNGGKGVATFTGFLAAFSFRSEGLPAFLVFISIFFILFFITGYVSLSSLVSVTAAYFMLMFNTNVYSSITLLVILLMIFIKHRTNIKRLLEGTEDKIFRRRDE